jgi:DNA-binding SARP family transcriptional activator
VAHVDTGQFIDAIDDARELVQLDPLREGPYQILMTALYARGEIAGALTTFRAASQLLATELGTDPSADLRRAHRDMLSQVPQRDLIRDLGSSSISPATSSLRRSASVERTSSSTPPATN